MKSRLEETALRFVAEVVHYSTGEDVAAIRHDDAGTSTVLTENGRAYRVRAVIAVEELS